jgi:hypothetical protein
MDNTTILVLAAIALVVIVIFMWYKHPFVMPCDDGDRCVNGECCFSKKSCNYPNYKMCFGPKPPHPPHMPCSNGDKCVHGKCCMTGTPCDYPMAHDCAS